MVRGGACAVNCKAFRVSSVSFPQHYPPGFQRKTAGQKQYSIVLVYRPVIREGLTRIIVNDNADDRGGRFFVSDS